MKPVNDRLVQKTTTIFSLLIFVLALTPIASLVLSVIFARDQDEFDTVLGPTKFYYWSNLPFTVAVFFTTLINVFASLTIFVANLKSNKTKTVYYSSIIGMLATFGMASFVTHQAVQYNFATRKWPKQDGGLFPTLMPLYWSYQVVASALFLFVLPMYIYIFYNKLSAYLAIQRAEQKEKKKSHGLQWWLLSLFLLHTLSQIWLIIKSYMFSAKEDTEDYRQDNIFDMLTSYYYVALIVQFVGVVILMRNLHRPWITKAQSISLTVLMGLFMMGTFVFQALITSRLFIELHVAGDIICALKDCGPLDNYKWDLLGCGSLNAVCVVLFVPFLSMVSTSFEQEENRETLITVEERVEIE